MKTIKGRAGGLAKVAKIHNEYLANPNLCKNCSQPIQLKKYICPSVARKMTFCSTSCAAKTNNRLIPKRKINLIKCSSCPAMIPRQRKFCITCRESKANGAKRKDQLNRRLIYHHGRSVVRGRIKVCAYCGYDKHVEMCHIIPIRNFSKDATVGEINSSDNLIFLCPNHHWEFDNNLLSIKQIKQEPTESPYQIQHVAGPNPAAGICPRSSAR